MSSPNPQENAPLSTDEVDPKSLPVKLSSQNFFVKTWNQIKALSIKSFILQFRQYKTNIAQLLIPVFCMVLVFILQTALQNVTDRINERRGNNQSSVSLPFKDFNLLRMLSVMNSTINSPSYSGTDIMAGRYFTVDDTKGNVLGAKYLNATGSGFLNNVAQLRLRDMTPAQNLYMPYFEQKASLTTAQQSMFDESLATGAVIDTAALIAVSNLNSTSLRFSLTYDNISRSEYCKYASIFAGTGYGLCDAFAQFSGMDIMHQPYLRTETSDAVRLESTVAQMPFTARTRNIELSDILLTFFGPLVLSLLLPVVMYGIVLEKENQIRELMSINGLKFVNYVIVTYVFNYLTYILVAIEFVILGIAFGYTFLVDVSPLIYIVMLILWGFNLVSFAFFASAFFGNTLTASIFGYIVVLMMPSICYVLEVFVMCPLEEGTSAFKCQDSMRWLMLLYSSPIVHTINWTVNQCTSGACNSPGDLFADKEVLLSMVFLIVDAVLYLVLGLYLERVLPQPFGVRKSVFFPIKDLWKLITSRFARKRHMATIKVEDDPNMDDDVKAMRDQIISEEVTPDDSTIWVREMVKRYPTGKLAVKGISFYVPKSGAVSLLGANGAGKSTTVSMLTGATSITSGDAYVNGLSVKTDMEKIRRSIGLCPQFDVLYTSLTPLEHLTFYCRIKGVKNLKQHCRHLLEAVDLTKHRNKLVSTLSLGIRRRLSIAIALVGGPSLVLLDECTTGVSEKRKLWECVLEQKKYRTFIIITHFMEEASVLADSHYIMCRGRVMCAGSSMHLKSKYGGGYKIVINLKSEEDMPRLKEFMKDFLPKSKIYSELSSSITFQCHPQYFKTSSLFDVMQTKKEDFGIVDWSINQATVEDVFLNIVSEDSKRAAEERREERAKPKSLIQRLKKLV